MKGSHCSLCPPSQTPLVSVVALGFPWVSGPLLSDGISQEGWGRSDPPTSHFKLFPSWQAAGTFRLNSIRIKKSFLRFLSPGDLPRVFFSLTVYLALFRSLPTFLRSTGRWRAEFKALHLCSVSIFSWGNIFSVEKQPNPQRSQRW